MNILLVWPFWIGSCPVTYPSKIIRGEIIGIDTPTQPAPIRLDNRPNSETVQTDNDRYRLYPSDFLYLVRSPTEWDRICWVYGEKHLEFSVAIIILLTSHSSANTRLWLAPNWPIPAARQVRGRAGTQTSRFKYINIDI